MKILYLFRHAKSYWGDQSLPDFERPLNKRGKRDAPFMGAVLKDKKVSADTIIASPAKRAKKTAFEISLKLGFSQKKILFREELYDASSNDILTVIKSVDEKYSSVMIFGHNPGLTLLNNYLSGKYIDNIPTCGIVALKLYKKWCDLDRNTCEHLFFEYPKLYHK